MKIAPIHARARDGAEERCPFCREAFTAQDVASARTACTACGTPHHRACFLEHGQCSMLGCGGRETLADRRAGESAGAIGAFDVTVAATIIFVALQTASLVSKGNDATGALQIFALASLLVAVVAALVGGINAHGWHRTRPLAGPPPDEGTRLPTVEHASLPLPTHDSLPPFPLPTTEGRAP